MVRMMEYQNADVVIVGTGASGLFAALHLPEYMNIIMITKTTVEESDSFLAQGGICVLKDEEDYESFMDDTMKAGHYENRKESVDIMIRSSRGVIEELIGYGVRFAMKNGHLDYTREGCHSKPRILFHEDITGKEITSHLLAAVKKLPNVTLMEHTTMVDIIEEENRCKGILTVRENQLCAIYAKNTILASGGIGGLYEHSTNYAHLTGDALAISLRHGVQLENIDYIQIHPTTLFSTKKGRRFLISESVRGEGAKLYGADGKRFANEVLPRDILTKKIHEQMEKDQKPYVWLDMTGLGKDVIFHHFPHIYETCLNEGYDVTKEWIPVVPAQHYFMGGIHVDSVSKTSMEHLYAVGETSCNGVHGANRLASNSLLESLVFGKRAAADIIQEETRQNQNSKNSLDIEKDNFKNLAEQAALYYNKNKNDLIQEYKMSVLDEIERERKAR